MLLLVVLLLLLLLPSWPCFVYEVQLKSVGASGKSS